MQRLDLEVIQQALAWSEQSCTIYLCTVLSTFGSSPREPGSLLVANPEGDSLGSLSGGCVEEDFLARIRDGAFTEQNTVIRYGDANDINAPQIQLPCGGILEILVEKLEPTPVNQHYLKIFLLSLNGVTYTELQPEITAFNSKLNSANQINTTNHPSCLRRSINTKTNQKSFEWLYSHGDVVEHNNDGIFSIRLNNPVRIIIAGLSMVSIYCAQFAQTLGYSVTICDPRENITKDFNVNCVDFKNIMPSSLFSATIDFKSTAIVALTHDPRIDDLTMMDAISTNAFYIGVMGSKKTSNARAERLQKIAKLNDQQLARIQMPIGLALGSKTPAEIALAVVADILRVYRGRPRDAL